MKPTRLICILTALAANAVHAQEEPFDASIALGYVGTTGNTETTTFNTEVLATWRTGSWTHNAKLQGLAAQENDIARAERYYLEEKSDYNLDERQYVFGTGSYTDDRFSGYDYQAMVAVGYGRHLIRRDDMTLEAFGGPGYRENVLDDGPTVGEGIITLGEKFGWQISPNAALTQSLTADVGEELSVTKFDIGLETNIVGSITTKLAFQARHISEVPAGNENTDTLTSVSLVYNF